MQLAEVLLSLPDSETDVAAILSSGVTGVPLILRLREIWARRQVELQELMDGMQTEGQMMQGLLNNLNVGEAQARQGILSITTVPCNK